MHQNHVHPRMESSKIQMWGSLVPSSAGCTVCITYIAAHDKYTVQGAHLLTTARLFVVDILILRSVNGVLPGK